MVLWPWLSRNLFLAKQGATSLADKVWLWPVAAGVKGRHSLPLPYPCQLPCISTELVHPDSGLGCVTYFGWCTRSEEVVSRFWLLAGSTCPLVLLPSVWGWHAWASLLMQGRMREKGEELGHFSQSQPRSTTPDASVPPSWDQQSSPAGPSGHGHWAVQTHGE